MNNYWHKDYYVMFERNQHNGSIKAIASSDNDRFGVVFYDYPLSTIKRRINKQIRYRLENNIVEA